MRIAAFRRSSSVPRARIPVALRTALVAPARAVFRIAPPLLFSLGSLSATASAQTTDVIGVRANGMAGAFTAVADDATAGWWNPAGLAGGALFNGLVEYGRPEKAQPESVRGFAAAYPALG